MRVEIDFDFMDESLKPTKKQLKDWIGFTIGSTCELEGGNPMDEIDFFEDLEVTITVK